MSAAIAVLEAARSRGAQALNAARSALNSADAAYTRALDQVNRDLAAARAAVDRSQAAYDAVVAQPRRDVAAAEATVAKLTTE